MPCPVCNGFAAESDEFAACGCGTNKESEEEAYSYAYNEGHADARKREPYKPNLTSKGTKDFNKVLKQRAESDDAEDSCVSCRNVYDLEFHKKMGNYPVCGECYYDRFNTSAYCCDEWGHPEVYPCPKCGQHESAPFEPDCHCFPNYSDLTDDEWDEMSDNSIWYCSMCGGEATLYGAESFEADSGWPHYVCKKNKKTYKRTKIHPSWGEFGYPNAVCWNCMGYECVSEMLKGYAERGLPSHRAEWSEIDEAHALLRRKEKKARDLARKAARRNKQIRYQMGAEGMEMTPDIEGYPGLPVVPDSYGTNSALNSGQGVPVWYGSAETFEAYNPEQPRDSGGRWSKDEEEKIEVGEIPYGPQITLRQLAETMMEQTGIPVFDLAYKLVQAMLGSHPAGDTPVTREILLETLEETGQVMRYVEETDYDYGVQVMVDMLRQAGMEPPLEMEEQVHARIKFEDEWAAETFEASDVPWAVDPLDYPRLHIPLDYAPPPTGGGSGNGNGESAPEPVPEPPSEEGNGGESDESQQEQTQEEEQPPLPEQGGGSVSTAAETFEAEDWADKRQRERAFALADTFEIDRKSIPKKWCKGCKNELELYGMQVWVDNEDENGMIPVDIDYDICQVCDGVDERFEAPNEPEVPDDYTYGETFGRNLALLAEGQDELSMFGELIVHWETLTDDWDADLDYGDINEQATQVAYDDLMMASQLIPESWFHPGRHVDVPIYFEYEHIYGGMGENISVAVSYEFRPTGRNT